MILTAAWTYRGTVKRDVPGLGAAVPQPVSEPGRTELLVFMPVRDLEDADARRSRQFRNQMKAWLPNTAALKVRWRRPGSGSALGAARGEA